VRRQPNATTNDQKAASGIRRPINRQVAFRPGQKLKGVAQQHASTGGPANTGIARPNNPRTYPPDSLNQVQPTWREFESDFIGFAASSKTPDTSGGGAHHSHGDLKANAFRQLGDIHGGRQ
jgi:hypothetical protein